MRKSFGCAGAIGTVLWFPLIWSTKGGEIGMDTYILAGVSIICFFIMLASMFAGGIDENK